MNEKTLAEWIQDNLSASIVEFARPVTGRMFLRIQANSILYVTRLLKEKAGITHLCTITGLDLGENFELLYHFAYETGCLTLRFTVPKALPNTPSICSCIPGAILYERELQDMFGLVFENLPDSRRLLLPEDWPAGAFPLRKDWKFERTPEVIPGGEQ